MAEYQVYFEDGREICIDADRARVSNGSVQFIVGQEIVADFSAVKTIGYALLDSVKEST